MVGIDLTSRLEMLVDLGVHFRFGEPPEEEPEERAINSEDEIVETLDRPAEDLIQADHGSLSPDAPQLIEPSPPWSKVEEVTSVVPLDCSNFRVGEPADEDIDFCSWKVICTYPDHFIGKANKPRAQPYFAKILEGRVWDFFYLHNPENPSDSPRLLVPSLQFESFLRGVNRELGTSLAIPGGANQDRFYMRFGQGGTPQPRYLKRSRDQKNLDIESWPNINQSDIDAFISAPTMRQEDWKINWNLMAPRAAIKDKKKNAERRAAQRKADRERMIYEAQEYLHITGNNKQNVVFVCVDVEAIEVSPNPISEVGIAILDTKDIDGVDAGASGSEWWQFIKSFHLRTKEYSGLVNHRYIRGCPDNFDFGTSIFPTKAELPNAIETILEPYTNEERCLVFVGHDVNQDIKYLSSIGFEVHQLKDLVSELDTKEIHQAWRGWDNGRSLQAVLSDLYIPSQHLHNAGNDAVYTLRALIGLAFEQIRRDEAKQREEEYMPALMAVDQMTDEKIADERPMLE